MNKIRANFIGQRATATAIKTQVRWKHIKTWIRSKLGSDNSGYKLSELRFE